MRSSRPRSRSAASRPAPRKLFRPLAAASHGPDRLRLSRYHAEKMARGIRRSGAMDPARIVGALVGIPGGRTFDGFDFLKAVGVRPDRTPRLLPEVRRAMQLEAQAPGPRVYRRGKGFVAAAVVRPPIADPFPGLAAREQAAAAETARLGLPSTAEGHDVPPPADDKPGMIGFLKRGRYVGKFLGRILDIPCRPAVAAGAAG